MKTFTEEDDKVTRIFLHPEDVACVVDPDATVRLFMRRDEGVDDDLSFPQQLILAVVYLREHPDELMGIIDRMFAEAEAKDKA